MLFRGVQSLVLAFILASASSHHVSSRRAGNADPLSQPVTPKLHARDGKRVVNWAAMGDSYASGIGAGVRGSNSGDYTCSRYTEAYPNVMNVVLDGTAPDQRQFFYVACSGAQTNNVRDDQANNFVWDVDIATLSIGGNDIGFFDIINNCIFQFYITASCQDQINIAQGKIDSEEFHANLDGAIGKILANARASQFRLYMSGYAHFWNTDSMQCEDVTWSWWNRADPPKLTRDLRIKLNALTSNLNNAINDAVGRANAADPRQPVVFVDYSSAFNGHRYCEEGVTEPDPNNGNTWFFEWETTDTTTIQATADQYPEGSIERQYADWIAQQRAEDGSLTPASQGSHWWVDSLAKVFHPRVDGHNAIKDVILASYAANPPHWGAFTPGWCGVHVTQYQKPRPGIDNYTLDVKMFDSAGNAIGEVNGADAPAGVGVGVTSALPYVLMVTAQNLDADAVLFAYGAQNWGSNDQEHFCDFGAYDGGKREGDCGFTC